MAIVLIISLYASRVVLQSLGVDDYGIYNVVGGFVALFGFLNTSLSASIQRFYNYEHGKNGESGVQRVYTMSCIIESVLAVFILIILEIIGLWYIDTKLVLPEAKLSAAHYVFQFSVLQLVLLMLQAPFTGAILARERMNFYAIVGIIEVIMKLVIVLILTSIPYDSLIVYGFLMTFISIADFLLFFIYAKYHFKELKLKGPLDLDLFKSMLAFSGWNAFGAMSLICRTQGLNLILNAFFGPIVNAARGVAIQIQTAVMGFIGNISIAARPQIVESYAENNIDRARNLTYSISKISYICLYTMFLPIAIHIDYLLRIWLGNTIPDYSASFSILILLASLIDVLNTPITILVMSTGVVGRYCFWTSMGGLLVLPLAYFALLYGNSPNSAFISGIVISGLVQIISIYELQRLKLIQVSDYLKKVVCPLAFVSIPSGGIVLLTAYYIQESFLSLCISTAVTLLSVSLLFYCFGCKKTEQEMIKLYIKKIRNK